MNSLGGLQVKVPAKPPRAQRSIFARALGEEAARIMVELFGGCIIEIPNGARLRAEQRRAAILIHPGRHGEVARDIGVTRRWVRVVRASARKAASQGGPLLRLVTPALQLS